MVNIYTYENKRKRERFSTLYSGSMYFPTNKSTPVIKTLGFVPINARTLSSDRYTLLQAQTSFITTLVCISIVMID